MKMKKLLSVFTALIITLSAFAVSASAAAPKLSKSSVNLPEGYAVTLKVSNASGKVAWSVKDSSVASVKSAGDNSAKVVGSKTGSTYVYAKTGGTTLKCKIIVKKSFISASSKTLEMEKGKSKTVTLTVKGAKSIIAEPDNTNVCSVIWGKKWDGDKINITVKAIGNGTANIRLYNKNAPDSTEKTISVTVGKQESSAKSAASVTFGGTADTANNNDTAASDTSDAILQIAELVNKERKAAGKSELELDDTLNEIAALRANEIVTKFSHTRPDGSACFTAYDEAGFKNYSAAENIAAGQNTPAEAMNSWMNSSGHKANILGDNYTKIGIGCCQHNGTYYWVQVFIG